jgi:hypothetical protein
MRSIWRILGWLLGIILALFGFGYVLLALGAIWPVNQSDLQYKAIWVARAEMWWLFAGILLSAACVVGYLNWKHRITIIRLLAIATASVVVMACMVVATLIDLGAPVNQSRKLIGYDVIGNWSFEARALNFGVTAEYGVVVTAFHNMGVFDERWVIVTSNVGDSVSVAPYGKDSVKVEILWNNPNNPGSTGLVPFKAVLLGLSQIGRHDPVKLVWP